MGMFTVRYGTVRSGTGTSCTDRRTAGYGTGRYRYVYDMVAAVHHGEVGYGVVRAPSWVHGVVSCLKMTWTSLSFQFVAFLLHLLLFFSNKIVILIINMFYETRRWRFASSLLNLNPMRWIKRYWQGKGADTVPNPTFDRIGVFIIKSSYTTSWDSTFEVRNCRQVADLHWFNADPDPAFFLEAHPDPDPDLDPRFGWPKNWKPFTTGKNYTFFWSKIAMYLFLGLHRGRLSYRRSLQPSKENIQLFKTWNLCTFRILNLDGKKLSCHIISAKFVVSLEKMAIFDEGVFNFFFEKKCRCEFYKT